MCNLKTCLIAYPPFTKPPFVNSRSLRGGKGVPRKGAWTSVNVRVWTCKDSRAKRDQTSCYLRPPFLWTPLVPSAVSIPVWGCASSPPLPARLARFRPILCTRPAARRCPSIGSGCIAACHMPYVIPCQTRCTRTRVCVYVSVQLRCVCTHTYTGYPYPCHIISYHTISLPCYSIAYTCNDDNKQTQHTYKRSR